MSDSSKRGTSNPMSTKVPTTRKVVIGQITIESRSAPTISTAVARTRVTVRRSIRCLMNLGISVSKLNVYVQVDVKV